LSLDWLFICRGCLLPDRQVKALILLLQDLQVVCPKRRVCCGLQLLKRGEGVGPVQCSACTHGLVKPGMHKSSGNRSMQQELKMQKQHVVAQHKKQISMYATGSMGLSGHGIPIISEGGFSFHHLHPMTYIWTNAALPGVRPESASCQRKSMPETAWICSVMRLVRARLPARIITAMNMVCSDQTSICNTIL
jgi:hypothetical protein